jgi:hypothetical protein
MGRRGDDSRQGFEERTQARWPKMKILQPPWKTVSG